MATPIELLLYILSIGYLTHVFLLGNLFYFTDKTVLVFYTIGEDSYVRPYDLLDRIRRLFMVYEKDQRGNWVVEYNGRMQLFVCPYCLAFWLNFFGLILLNLTGQISTVHSLYGLFAVPYLIGKVISYE